MTIEFPQFIARCRIPEPDRRAGVGRGCAALRLPSRGHDATVRLRDGEVEGERHAVQHVAAVALFGNGSQWVGPITNFNGLYSDRTIELCHGADPVCNPADPNTWKENWPQHLANAYIDAGMANQAADFVASKL